MGRQMLVNMKELLLRFRYADKKVTPNTNKVRNVESLDRDDYPDLYCNMDANMLNNLKKYKIFDTISFAGVCWKHFDENLEFSEFAFKFDISKVMEYKKEK